LIGCFGGLTVPVERLNDSPLWWTSASQLSNCQHQVPNRLGGRLDLDLDVVAEPVQAVHQLAFGEVGEVAAQHARHFGLGDAHAERRLVLSEAEFADCLGDLDYQAGFDLEFVGAGQAQVGKDVAGTGFVLDVSIDAFCHGGVPLRAPRRA